MDFRERSLRHPKAKSPHRTTVGLSGLPLPSVGIAPKASVQFLRTSGFRERVVSGREWFLGESGFWTFRGFGRSPMSDQRTVAVVGASTHREKFGNKAVRAYQRQGWTVFPVNPRGGQVEGLSVYPSVSEVPGEEPLDRVSFYVPPEVGLGLLDDVAQRGCRELFLNPGAESEQLLAAAEARQLNPVVGCSILDLGVSPQQVDQQTADQELDRPRS